MNTYILVEGINLDEGLFDTDQLSIIRGSSFLLKDAINCVNENFGELDPLSTGASSGLFLLDKDGSAATTVEKIIERLHREPFNCFTFLVESCESDNLLDAKERLYAQLRFNQLGSLSSAPDFFTDEHKTQKIPCQLNGARIAASKTQRKVQVRGQSRSRNLSLSVYRRLMYGRGVRQDFYFRELAGRDTEALKDFAFTDDLEELADHSGYEKLNNKVAVVYMDGNQFGKTQRAVLTQAQVVNQHKIQRDFDLRIQQDRTDFLSRVLEEMIREEGSRFPDAVISGEKKKLRFETLLWGGDEMLFILPAWLGFEFLQYFFEQSKSWRYPKDDKDSFPLTHAAGIVFCSAKSPIRITRDLARSLADTMKDHLGNERYQYNYWDYMVLESMDYPVTHDIEGFMSERYKKLAPHRAKTFFPHGNWTDLRKMLEQLIVEEHLSKRQLYRIVGTLQTTEAGGSIIWADLAGDKISEEQTAQLTAQEKAERRMLMLLEDDDRDFLRTTLPRLARDLFNIESFDSPEQRAWLWVHLIELWDYLIPQKKPEEKE